MSFLLKKNNARTVINQVGGINASALSVVVADVSSFPNSGDFLVTAWNKVKYSDPADDPNAEILKVTNVVNKTFTIARGQENTVGKVHANGSAVECLITAGTFEEIENEINASVGNMTKVVYDTNDNGIVDKSESVDDGVGNSKTASEIKNHIDDTNNPHSVTKAQVGLTNVPNLDTTDAVNNEHAQNTDTILQANIDLIVPQQVIKDSFLIENYEGRYDGQTFQADKTGTIDSVSVHYSREKDDLTDYEDLEITVRELNASGEPFGNILGTATIAKSAIPYSTPSEQVFTFSNVNVIAGTTYGFIVRQVDDGGNSDSSYHGFGTTGDSTYIKGKYFYSYNAGIDWSEVDITWDLGFNVTITGTPGEEVVDLIIDKQLQTNLDANSNTVENLKEPLANGDALRKTSVILESSLENTINKIHAQNTDTNLDTGGANSVSAEEIRNHIDASVPVHIIGEDLTDQVDGIKDTFTISNIYLINTTAVFISGQRIRRISGYIEETNTTIKFPHIIKLGEKIIVDYYK